MSHNLSHVVGGFAGGLASSVILQPFDLVKTRLQQRHSTITETIKSLKSYKELWRGTLPSAIRTSVGSALYLTSLNKFRTILAHRNHENANTLQSITTSSSLPKLTMTQNLVTGALTRGFIGFLTMPITILKVRYESTVYQYNSLTSAMTSIYKKEGIPAFFKGFTATAMRDAPYAGLYVLLYEQSKTILPLLLPSKHTSLSMTEAAMINSLGAFTAASLATTITAPFDTIKTRMQLHPAMFTSFWRTLVLIATKESPIRLFDGLSLRLTRKAFSAGIAWGIYEEIVKVVL